jgi:two-component system nitrate/nitrite response regulator NarL
MVKTAPRIKQRANLYGLGIPTDREEQIIELIARGFANKEIGKMVGTTEGVVKNYLRVIYDKLGVWNRYELALWYVKRWCAMEQKTTGKTQ